MSPIIPCHRCRCRPLRACCQDSCGAVHPSGERFRSAQDQAGGSRTAREELSVAMFQDCLLAVQASDSDRSLWSARIRRSSRWPQPPARSPGPSRWTQRGDHCCGRGAPLRRAPAGPASTATRTAGGGTRVCGRRFRAPTRRALAPRCCSVGDCVRSSALVRQRRMKAAGYRRIRLPDVASRSTSTPHRISNAPIASDSARTPPQSWHVQGRPDIADRPLNG